MIANENRAILTTFHSHKEWNGKAYVPGVKTWTAIGGNFKTEPSITSRNKDTLDIFTVGGDGKA